MSLSDPRVIFGVHSVTPYSRTSGLPYGIVRVLKDSSVSLQGELIELTGGSNKYPWAVEDGKVTSEMSLKFSEYPSFVFELFLGKAPTDNAAETTGNVSTLTNKKGTSTVASTGIATATALSGSEANLKFGKYVVVVTTSTTVNIYGSTDIDLTRGTDVEFQNDALKLLASNVTITSSTATDIASLGITLTGGAGTIGMTTGDTATFEVRPINTGSTTVRIGASTDTTPEFGCIIMAQKRGNGELFEIDAFRCKATGLPIGFAEKAFGEVEAKAKLLFDSVKNGVFDLRHVKAS